MEGDTLGVSEGAIRAREALVEGERRGRVIEYEARRAERGRVKAKNT